MATFIVPVAFVTYFPSLYILNKANVLKTPRWLPFISPVVAALFTWVAIWVWNFGVRMFVVEAGQFAASVPDDGCPSSAVRPPPPSSSEPSPAGPTLVDLTLEEPAIEDIIRRIYESRPTHSITSTEYPNPSA